MQHKPNILSILLLLTFFVGCIEPFDPDIKEYESVYVVDGELNNLPGPYEVRISKSYEYEAQEPEMVSGAEVIIMDDQGNEAILTEVEEGVYQTIDTDFRGIPGRSYKLRVTMAEDVVLESGFERLKNPVEIGKLYWEFEERPWTEHQGVQILLDTEDPQDESHYYAWEYEEYWRFSVQYQSRLIYPDEYVCWDSSMVNQRVLGTTTGFSEDAIKRKPLYFISNNTSRLERRYTTLVRQYVLTEEAYQFHRQLQNLNATTGTLFETIPYTLQGNLTHLGNPDIPVLGLFQVSPVAEKRIYINRSELPSDFLVADAIDNCISIQIFSGDTAEIDTLLFLGYKLFDSVFYEGFPAYHYAFASKAECFLCSRTGTKKEPSFWED